MNRIIAFICIAYLYLPAWAQYETRTIKNEMEQVHKHHLVNFIYDSSLKIDVPCWGQSLQKLDLKQSLKELFKNTDIKWEIKGRYVLLRQLRKYTISGYVFQESSEPLINATIMDVTLGIGTLSNEYGFFSITLSEGKRNLRFSYIGFGEKVEDILLEGNVVIKIHLKENYILDEVMVVSDLNSPVYMTQTGKTSLTESDLYTGSSLLSSPDVVKVLQNLSGVASGTEAASGLYVHGGNNDENLFLLDGTPLYQVNHLGGIFSTFNTDIIKNIDFYKSGFPARYGGRLSSVLDVRTKEGNMKNFHGTFSIGLLDGRIQLEGPIVKNRTSFNVAMRRTWLDLFSTPILFIRNKSQKDDNWKGKYAFHDINAKITHSFSDRSKVYISIYSGNDILKIENTQHFNEYNENSDEEWYNTKFNLQWGNLTTTAYLNYQISPKLFANFTGVYTHNHSRYDYEEEDKYLDSGELAEVTYIQHHNYSVIDDIGYRIELDYRPEWHHHIRIGSNYLFHTFRPQSRIVKDYSGGNEQLDTIQHISSHFYNGHEFTVYAEDDIILSEKWRANMGVHYTLFETTDRVYNAVEPRVAIKYQSNAHTAIKLSYTEMNQFMHQLSSTYLNLPTDYWVPSTTNIRPMRSRQYALGLYMQFPYHVYFSMESFYKTTRHILEYAGGNHLLPSVDNWESTVKDGKGRAYGLECDFSCLFSKISLNISYTLSWSKRKFSDIYPKWYADKFDNRHKVNIVCRHKINSTMEAYVAWVYHTGNKMTVPGQYVNLPHIPGIEEAESTGWLYDKPNNITLPAYHRMDLGVNFRKITKRGYERIWKVNIYNAYCRMNTLYARVIKTSEGKLEGKATGIFPILPSFSYTLKF